MIEIIRNRLYFTVIVGDVLNSAQHSTDVYYLNFDGGLACRGFNTDFGFLSVNISSLHNYCCKVNDYLHSATVSKPVVHYVMSNTKKRGNGPFLIGCYAIIYLQVQPQDIYRHLLSTRDIYRYVT